MAFQVNKYQTPLTDELLDSLDKEVRDDLIDAITNIEYIRNLISTDRRRAKDLPRDSQGRIRVDLTNPHILEDMDYFRPTALYFREHGVFTHLKPNPNPNSEFMKWLDTECDRCWNGMVRFSDGEWVTGDLYFYLNYMPIFLSKTTTNSKKAYRIEDFPDVWEGIYLWFHYMHQARERGLHVVQIARRGASKSYSAASILAKRFILGESKSVNKEVRGIAIAFKSEFLTKDGIINKFINCADFCAENTQFPSRRLKSSMLEMTWKMGYLDSETQLPKGTLNETLGISTKDDSSKVRGKRAQFIFLEEFGAFPNFLDTWNTLIPSVQDGEYAFGLMAAVGCVCAGTKVYRADGSICNVENLLQEDGIIGYDGNTASKEEITYIQDPLYKLCLKITTVGGKSISCSIDHPFLSPSKDKKKNRTFNFVEALNLREGDYLSLYIGGTEFGNEKMYEPRLLGLLLGDGSYANSSLPTLSINSNELYDYINNKYDIGISKLRSCNDGSIYAQVYFNGLKLDLIELNLWGQSKENKNILDNIYKYSKEDICEYLGGYFDADGNVQITRNRPIVKLTSKYKHLLDGVSDLLLKLGINSTIHVEKKGGGLLKSGVNNKEYEMSQYDCYVLYISNIHHVKKFRELIHFISKEKQRRLEFIDNIQDDKYEIYDNIQILRIKSIESIGSLRIYNLTANNTHTYIANGFVTHNTGGEEGNNFTGALEIIYNPIGYNVYPLPNVYDRNAQGKTNTVYFFGGYMNRKGFYNKDGVSDVTGALISILLDRVRVKYNSTDPMALTRRKAEIPITILDAIMLVTSTIYPVADLTDRLNQIDLDPKSLDDVLVGELFMKNGEVEFRPEPSTPVRNFPHKDNKQDGAVEIFKMPELDKNGRPFKGRYIFGIDPFDDDASKTLSLGAIKCLDTWTDRIVAQYTGRRKYADEFFEICRRLILFYNGEALYENNKKGLFAYFSKMNSLYLLADCPEFLRDKDMVKGELYGNKIKGAPSTAPIKAYGRRAIRDWLLKPMTVIVNNEDGDPEEITLPLLMHLKGRSLIQELTMWNPDINADEHDALVMLMLLREDRMIIDGDTTENERRSLYDDSDYIGNDEYFTRNYDNKIKTKNNSLQIY